MLTAKKTPAKKPAAKKTPAKKPAAKKTAAKSAPEKSAAGDEPTFALAALRAALGPSQPGLLDALLEGTSADELLELGRQIASERVVTDAARLYGLAWAFYQTASAEKRRQLRGFSQDLLALGIEQALVLEKLCDAQAAQRQVEREQRDTLAAGELAAWDRAIGLRDQAADALRGAAGQTGDRRQAVDAAIGTAENAPALARGLESLGRLLTDWLRQSAGRGAAAQALKVRLALYALDATYAEELVGAASALRKKAALAKNRPQGSRVTQADLDRADGLNLLLLGRVIRAFEHGHAVDPTIPRLVPIAARQVLARPSRPRPQQPAPTPTPA